MNVVAVAVFEGVEELDFVGPWEVLTGWRFLYPAPGSATTASAHDSAR